MEYTIAVRHDDVTEGMKRYALEKAQKFDRFSDLVRDGELILNFEDSQFQAEILLHPRHAGSPLVASESSNDMYAAIDLLMDKAERLLRKMKSKRVDHSRRGDRRPPADVSPPDDDEPDETYQDVIDETDF